MKCFMQLLWQDDYSIMTGAERKEESRLCGTYTRCYPLLRNATANGNAFSEHSATLHTPAEKQATT